MTEQEWQNLRRSLEAKEPQPARRKLHPISLVGKRRRADGMEGPLDWMPPGDPLAEPKPALSWEDVDR